MYNLFFHPLRKFPGPLLYRASSLPWAFRHAYGDQAFYTQRLHEEYGPIVRIGPNHLSFTDPQAFKDIYGHRLGGGPEMSKTDVFSRTIRAVPTSILNADREEHGRVRRALAHGFSDSSMRQQESMIVEYVDLLVQRLHEECDNGKRVLNMEEWYNWTTFDIVGNLVFGQAFGSLKSTKYHPWIVFIMRSIRVGAILVAMEYIGLGILVQLMFKFTSLGPIKEMRQYTDDMLTSRLSMEEGQDDLFEGLVKRREEWVSAPNSLLHRPELSSSPTRVEAYSSC